MLRETDVYPQTETHRSITTDHYSTSACSSSLDSTETSSIPSDNLNYSITSINENSETSRYDHLDNEIDNMEEGFDILYEKFKQLEEEDLQKKYRLVNEIEIIRKESHEKYMSIRNRKMKFSEHNIFDRGINITNYREYQPKNDAITELSNKPNDTAIIESDTGEYKVNYIYEKPLNHEAIWRKGTILIVGDSMLYGIEENKLKNAKVRVFPGASIEDLVYHLTPLLRKNPSTVIIHIGTNNCVYDNSSEIIGKLKNLKVFISNQIPNCKIILSSLIKRNDIAKAQMTVKLVNEKLKNLNTEIMDNSNIDWSHIGRKGLHLTPHGTGKLAVNIIKKLKSL